MEVIQVSPVCAKKIQVNTKKRDEYGCLNYCPVLKVDAKSDQVKQIAEVCKKLEGKEITTIEDEDMAIIYQTYEAQRHYLVESKSLVELLSKMPFILNKKVFNDHVVKLTGNSLEKSMETLEKKVNHVLDVTSKKYLSNCTNKAVKLVSQVASYFGEKIEDILVKVKVS